MASKNGLPQSDEEWADATDGAAWVTDPNDPNSQANATVDKLTRPATDTNTHPFSS